MVKAWSHDPAREQQFTTKLNPNTTQNDGMDRKIVQKDRELRKKGNSTLWRASKYPKQRLSRSTRAVQIEQKMTSP